ncbi:glycosyltransferase [Pelotalea chapellei]|uniref:Glycosyltransferase family 2 protein n=1 Tax=Pelotalea chapellei TaxID=44671 RepID=A0ABS5U5B1_9BACT|nr:glycosyltransferase [Pelotalea chapellei]MBT1070844.1 glycosyltransferase family 2 protein [Pelotalea chapellei]
MKISIIICTYNRCASLEKTMERLAALIPRASCECELLVVDNNSSDDTRGVVENFINGPEGNIRYLFEGRQGKSYALNTAIEAAEGDVLAFTDDDVLVDWNWLIKIHGAFQDEGISCAGGRIVPRWGKRCPPWLTPELHPYLALLDLGDRKKRMTEPMLWGANLIIRKSMFKKYGLFDVSLGRTGGKLYGNEEIELIRNLIIQGEGVYYLPEIVVQHCINENRMQKNYFRKWMFDAGELEGIQMGHYPHRNLMGVPYYMVKDAFTTVVGFAKDTMRRKQNIFLDEMFMCKTLGFINGRVKYHRSLAPMTSGRGREKALE